jgi:endonuclease IV
MHIHIKRVKKAKHLSKNDKMKLLDKIRIGLCHASYHRNLRYAEEQKEKKDINKFKKHIYRAENAWRRLVQIQEKYKK